MVTKDYEDFIRARITELRLKKNVSEHRMSMDLDKSGSYIRGITNGLSMPSVKELINIILYFEMTPYEFFLPLDQTDTAYSKLCARLREANATTLDNVNKFLDMLE